jgi:hypothetical protein
MTLNKQISKIAPITPAPTSAMKSHLQPLANGDLLNLVLRSDSMARTDTRAGLEAGPS